MKRIISLLLSAAVACSILSYSLGVSADSPNLLENGSFEDGIGTFTKSGNCILEESEESQDGDGRSALVSAREQNHSSVSFQAADIVQQQGSGEYTFSGWVKLAEADAPNIKLAATYQLSWGNKNETRKWPMGTKTELSYDDWMYLEVKTEIAAEKDGDPISEVKLYFVQDAFDASQAPDLLFDNLSFIKHGEYVEITPAPEVEVPTSKDVQSVKGFETTQIGAIRWDAYFETGSSPTAVSDQVAACLSPAKYHWTAPFFAQVASDGKVSFPKETLALWEEEAQYAIDAGIDYFAYLWYDSNDPMSYARKFHTQSELRDTIKMTGILESLNRSAATFEELFAAMKEDYWLYMDGMPVIYVYEANQKDQSFVEQLRKMAAQAGIAEPLYIIGMGYGDAAAAILGANNDFDAASFYSTGAVEIGSSYAELCQKSLENHNKVLPAGAAMPLVPCATMGRDTRARIETGVSWCENTRGGPDNLQYGGKFAYTGTPEEIGTQLLDMLNYTKRNRENTKCNTVLLYAWNEHDEGGWICPTLACDDEGNVLYNEDGTAKRNTAHIDAVKKAIASYRSQEANAGVYTDLEGNIVEGTPPDTNVPNSSAPVSSPDMDKNDSSGGSIWLYIGIGAAVIVVAAVVAVVGIRQKKSKNAPEEK